MSLPVDVADRRSILRVMLMITILPAILFSAFNWMIDLTLFAGLELAVAFIWMVIWSVSKTTPHVQRWSLVYLITLMSLTFMGVLISRFQSGLYVWLFIFPILSYLLLGRRIGFILTAISVLLGLGSLGWRVWQQTMEVHWIILANFGVCAVAIWAMAHVYEYKREKMIHRLHEIATQDPLTGLLNRRTLIETLSAVLYRARRRLEPVTIVYIDINEFKLINDTQGHNHGDNILLAVAQAIQYGTRLEDYAFRLGGDEFCIIFANCTASHAKDIYASRIANKLQNLEQALSLSLGYAQADPDNVLSPEELIQQADQDMYNAKRAEKLEKPKKKMLTFF